MEYDNQSALAQVEDLNARIDRLPRWGLASSVFIILGLLYFFVFYDITALGAVLPTLTKDLHLAGNESLPVTSNLIGYIIGALVLGNVADYFGRRKAVVYTILILAIGAILTAFSWNAISLTVFRFIVGLGIGAQISLAATFLGEFSPARFRGRYLAYSAIGAAVGNGLPPFLALPLLNVPHNGWRILFGLPALVIILLFFFRDRWIPESPRWLALHGRSDEAERVVARMEESVRNATGAELPVVPKVPPESSTSGLPMIELFKSQYLSRTVLIFVFWFLYYIFIYAYLAYGPTLVHGLGLPLHETLLFTGIGNIGFVVGVVVQLLIIDRAQRKYLIVGGLVAATIGAVLIAVSSSPIEIIVGGFLVTFANFSVVTPAYTYTAEIFPTRARASAMAIGDGLGHAGGAVQPFIIFAVLAAFGARGAFWTMGLVAVLTLIVILGGVRTTKESLTKLAK